MTEKQMQNILDLCGSLSSSAMPVLRQKIMLQTIQDKDCPLHIGCYLGRSLAMQKQVFDTKLDKAVQIQHTSWKCLYRICTESLGAV